MGHNFYLYLSQDKKEYFSLPKKWVVSHFVEATEEAALPSVGQMVLDALSQPVGTEPLSHLASQAQNIAIIVDDATRPTPVNSILKALLSHIETSGFPGDKITNCPRDP
jgi:nickel-dependent lactate racemase